MKSARILASITVLSSGVACGVVPPNRGEPSDRDAAPDAATPTPDAATPTPDAATSTPDAAGDAGDWTRPECIPSCLWDALTACMPVIDQCYHSASLDPSGALGTETTWGASVRWMNQSVLGFHYTERTITTPSPAAPPVPGGMTSSVCLRISSGFIPTGFNWINYLDGAGRMIATSDGKTLTCADTGVSYPAPNCRLPTSRCKSTSEFPGQP